MVGLDGMLYLLLEEQQTASSRVIAYDTRQKTWKECAATPKAFAQGSMTAHDGKLVVAGVNRDTGIVLSYDPASDAWSENDAVNFPLHAALVDYQGDLLVVGQLSRYMDVDAGDGQGGDGGQNSDCSYSWAAICIRSRSA